MNEKPTYVILGATGGIGNALCARLAQRPGGATIVALGRDGDKLRTLNAEYGADALEVDATRMDDVDAAFAGAVERHGAIAGVVNCVGSVLLKPAHITTEREWMNTLHTNLTSAFATVKYGAKQMMKSGGAIVLVSSAAARTGLSNHEAIAAAKGGVIGLTQSAAASYGARGIRVNCIAPGMVRTPATEKITSSERALAASTAMHALGRIGEPGDVASAIEWLLDPAQGWVTGQVIGVDGGLGTVRTSASSA